jgi:CelD/BcsL family acetyltransferase involved in cellulose biosynthesis
MRHPFPAAMPATAAGSRIARVSVFDSFEAAEPHWRLLEAADCAATPYQRYDFLQHWARHIGAAQGITPFIVIGFDAGGAPAMLLPLGSRAIAALKVVEFLGGKHCNFNFGIWRRDIAATLTRDDVEQILSKLKTQADVLLLANQPERWQGLDNPLGLLPRRPSPSMGYSGALKADFDALMQAEVSSSTRRKIRKKGEHLAAHGPVRFARADTPDEVRRVLDTFFAQKVERMRTRGLPDVFASDDVHAFITAATTIPGGSGQAPIELYSLSVGDDIIGTFGGVCGGGRFSCMFNSIILDRYSTESPGEQILVHLVRACCERGLSRFDLGVGEARYKSLFCGEVEPLFESFLPLTPAGRLAGATARGVSWLKRVVKRNPQLRSLIETARRWRGRFGSSPRPA